MIRPARWRPLLIAAALPLIFLPLRAAETPPAQPPAEQPVELPEAPPAPPPQEEEAPAAAEDPGERVSADNNLSFPVDI